ncbi:Pimeloyl-ACP methyl ester carboxylesterase [Mesorhizobium albiziae]|uniref:Pimeloyl-ACP methyl ester carboxylesterase n=1 Tax=Neomesorhizobium albiziae TaxID=335020 RepID=A0A1I4ANG5_9HYPH|nr:alpha/beta hydrolase [Mesorhizobium albiziae]GLS32983.1 alpha/beta hydrolase [Mesorhizobium albiziae]SFK58058.1 Pimeloyl-ACP methyl ester carboxylesterase [Mesorhizobium albiziae]
MDISTGFSDFFYSAQDGLKLHARIYGDDGSAGLPVICLPGLTRNARDFHDLALFLSRDAQQPRKVIAFDYRGRGRSAYDPNWKNYDVVVEAGDILAGLTALGVEHGAFVGTSRGGLIIHVLAAMRPAVLKAVVLNDIGPVVEGEGLAHIRAYLERAPKPKNLADAVAVQKAVHAQAFSALSDADWERFIRAIYREESGVPVPDFDPALLNVVKGMDLTQPLPVLWPQFEGLKAVPMLAIRGANSKLLSAATLAEMASRHPDCRTVTVDGQGHAPLLETGELPATLAAFLTHAEQKSSTDS